MGYFSSYRSYRNYKVCKYNIPPPKNIKAITGHLNPTTLFLPLHTPYRTRSSFSRQ